MVIRKLNIVYTNDAIGPLDEIIYSDLVKMWCGRDEYVKLLNITVDTNCFHAISIVYL